MNAAEVHRAEDEHAGGGLRSSFADRGLGLADCPRRPALPAIVRWHRGRLVEAAKIVDVRVHRLVVDEQTGDRRRPSP